MYQIKNVINYDREALTHKMFDNMKGFCEDERFSWLTRRIGWIPRLNIAVSYLSLVFPVCSLCLILFEQGGMLPLVLSLIGLGISIADRRFVHPWCVNLVLKYTQEMAEISATYRSGPAMGYHSFVVQHGAEGMEIWGYETGDSQFEVTLSKQVGEELKKKVILFKYDERDPAGVLTLDVGNETVCRINV